MSKSHKKLMCCMGNGTLNRILHMNWWTCSFIVKPVQPSAKFIIMTRKYRIGSWKILAIPVICILAIDISIIIIIGLCLGGSQIYHKL